MCYGFDCFGSVDIALVFIIYVEEGVNHGKRADDKTRCAMVMFSFGHVVIPIVL